MKKEPLNPRVQAKRLLRLYSLWHRTYRSDIQQQCLMLLGKILAREPDFSLRQEFQLAF